MGTTLDNGTYLPDEGERNCYEGLAGNWVALDNHLGSINIHVTINDKQAWNGHVADTTIHVTAEDKEAWNGKADASALTAHTGDTTIHVTAEDKAAWNGKADASALTTHTGDTTIHVTAEDKEAWNGKADASALTTHTGDTTIHVTSADKQAWDGHVADSVKHVTAEDKAKWDAVTSKADDSDVVHRSGDETVIGSKRFGNVQSFTGYPTIRLYSTIDDITVLPSSVRQQDIRYTDKNNNIIAYFIFQHRSNANEPFRTCWRQNKLDGTSGYYSVNFNNLGEFYPENNNAIDLGRSSNKWSDVQTYKVNALEPSSLSLPGIDNRIDISGYITNLTGVGNEYTPTVNGWICIRSGNAAKISILDRVTSIGNCSISNTATYLTVMTPVVANRTVLINIMCTSLEFAYFIPCQGNI